MGVLFSMFGRSKIVLSVGGYPEEWECELQQRRSLTRSSVVSPKRNLSMTLRHLLAEFCVVSRRLLVALVG